MARFLWQKKPKEDGTEEFTLPDELTVKIEAGANAAADLTPKVTQILESLAGINKFVETQTARETAKAVEAASSRRAEAVTETEERIESLMLEGKTKEAIALANQPLINEIMLTRADRIKREVFEDAEKFPYYHGDVKKEIDALLEVQPVQFRNSAQNVENCYDTVLGKHIKELVEGKLKNRFAGSEGSRGTSTGSAGSSSTVTKDRPAITDEVRKAARLLGYKAEDYAKLLDDEGVGYV